MEQLQKGSIIWTTDVSGDRIAARVIQTASTFTPVRFKVTKVILDDGRSVTASPGHPTADGRPLGDCQAGDILDGGRVKSAETIVYEGGETYDILPEGNTGLYWANGVLLKSTLGK